jgi:hypothetical protein
MPAPIPPEATTDVSETWRAYQTEDHERRVELIVTVFSVLVLGGLTVVGIYVVLQPDAQGDQVKLAYGWIGAVLGACCNVLRRP